MNSFGRFLIRIANVFFPFKVYGKENFPDGKAVICSNHLSAIDVTFFPIICRDNLFFLAKKELFKRKFSAKFLTYYGGIPIDRENPEVKSIISAIKVLKDGNKLVVFPEGTRNKSGKGLLPFKGGSLVFAVKSKSPIVPIIISNKAKLFKRTHILVGKSFELSQFYDVKLTDEVISSMEKILYDKMSEMQIQLADIMSKKGKKK